MTSSVQIPQPCELHFLLVDPMQHISIYLVVIYRYSGFITVHRDLVTMLLIIPIYIYFVHNRCTLSVFIYLLQDILSALSAPHQGQEEPLYPGTCRRSKEHQDIEPAADDAASSSSSHQRFGGNAFSGGPQGPRGGQTPNITWRFRVPDGETVTFTDGHFGPQSMVGTAWWGLHERICCHNPNVHSDPLFYAFFTRPVHT